VRIGLTSAAVLLITSCHRTSHTGDERAADAARGSVESTSKVEEALAPEGPIEVPTFVGTIDVAAKAAGIPVLRWQKLGRNEREIRIWEGFGLFVPQFLRDEKWR
jgi:hypothetical protein